MSGFVILAAAMEVAAAEPQSLAGRGFAVDTPAPRPGDHRLVWADEFDRPGAPDPSKWSFDTYRNRAGWYNEEKQYYAADRLQNARVEDGRLIIEARHDDLDEPKPADWGGQRYSSARLVSKGKGDWTYGFFEVRAKLACGRGTWPAIWMLPTEGASWPEGGEIDILEHVGWDEGVVHGTLHTAKYNHARQTGRGGSAKLTDACTSFHRYQLTWTAEHILIGVDDRAFVRVVNDEAGDRAAWPFDRPFHLLLNLAVGGWGGQKGIDPAAFPARFEIDYVRVYQAPAGAD